MSSRRSSRSIPELSNVAPQLFVVVSLVRMHLPRTVDRSASLGAHKRDNVYGRQQLLTVGEIRARQYRRQRQTVLICRLMALGSRMTSIERQWAECRTDKSPFFAPLAQMKTVSTNEDIAHTGMAPINEMGGLILASISPLSVCQT